MSALRPLLVALAMLAAAPAAAATTIVLESHVGARAADATYVLDTLHGELGDKAYSYGSRLGAVIEERVSRPGESASRPLDAAALARVKAGYEKWLSGEFAAAVEELSASLEVLRANPAVIARDQMLRDQLQRTLVGLALAHKRLGNHEQAAATMAELVRSFPDRGVERSQYGPEAVELYRSVEAGLEQQGVGKLRIEVDDPSAVIFLNDRYLSVGTAEERLVPGRYRVFVQRSKVPGRVHEVTVATGGEQLLRIEWGFDRALQTTGFTGFLYESETERARFEAGHAAALARMLDAEGVVTTSVRDYEGRRSVVGSVLARETGKPMRAAVLPLEPAMPGVARIQSLARFLAGDAADPELQVVQEPQAHAPGTRDSGGAGRVLAWTGVVIGVAAMGTGAYLIHLDGQGTCEDDPCQELHDTQNVGIATLAGGAVVTGLATWWLLGGDDDEPTAGAAIIAPSRRGLSIGYLSRF